MESIDKSLQRIGTDYLDMYFCHRFDDETPVEETCRAMDDLIHQGKVLYWGTSEWSAAQIQEALDVCERYNLYKPQVEQPHYNLLVQEKMNEQIIPIAEKEGLGLVIWSPLASGVLTGKYDDGFPDESRLARLDWLRSGFEGSENDPFEKTKLLKPIADDLGLSRAQLALAWTIRQNTITSAITGATKLEQLQQNLSTLEAKIDDDVWTKVDTIFS
jgi:aryl-alcohol dehydrogenase-like predicted oxidoreductase